MIELVQYGKKYGKKVLYEPTSLTIPSNAISFLMGKNGCGKTTLLKSIAGLVLAGMFVLMLIVNLIITKKRSAYV